MKKIIFILLILIIFPVKFVISQNFYDYLKSEPIPDTYENYETLPDVADRIVVYRFVVFDTRENRGILFIENGNGDFIIDPISAHDPGVENFKNFIEGKNIDGYIKYDTKKLIGYAIFYIIVLFLVVLLIIVIC